MTITRNGLQETSKDYVIWVIYVINSTSSLPPSPSPHHFPVAHPPFKNGSTRKCRPPLFHLDWFGGFEGFEEFREGVKWDRYYMARWQYSWEEFWQYTHTATFWKHGEPLSVSLTLDP